MHKVLDNLDFMEAFPFSQNLFQLGLKFQLKLCWWEDENAGHVTKCLTVVTPPLKNLKQTTSHVLPQFHTLTTDFTTRLSLINTKTPNFPMSRFNLKGGEFVFPDFGFDLGFKSLDRISWMVWRTLKYKKLKMYPELNNKCHQLGFYLQFKTKTVPLFNKIKSKCLYWET
ncbi:hypothetical protein VP01_953g6 [Puccinia sorghi]|uniref:Uncharacterized protein n=1 Tax=Puccinia sorghi TaxID=27349 RepID=A0A0L6U6B0_9BASI|nr:hypothetical protein VP01_953g6 [Puccinia sorghi]